MKVNQSMVRLGVTIVLLSSAIAIRFDIPYVLSVYIYTHHITYLEPAFQQE